MDLVESYGVDQVRYFFMREVPYGQDGNYSHEAIVDRMNADLANDLGNLAQRSLSMINKNCGGAVPRKGELNDDDRAILAEAAAVLEKARRRWTRIRRITRWLKFSELWPKPTVILRDRNPGSSARPIRPAWKQFCM